MMAFDRTNKSHPKLSTKEKYGAWWDARLSAVEIEMSCIKLGGQWTQRSGKVCGLGLYQHYLNLQQAIWPEDDYHRWATLLLREFIENRITSIMGPKDSGKTHSIAKYALTDYFCFPDETLIMISSTEIRGLEYRIWGDIKSLYQRAKERFDWVPGHIIDSKHAICTDDLKEDGIRDMRKGLICLPCLSSSGQWVGLGRYVGIKQKRRRLFSDEMQFMKTGLLDSIANLNSGDFKGIFAGNPIGEGDPLDKVAEPKDGWDSIAEPDKTTTWANRFIDGKTVNLVGTDSPNFDPPETVKPRFPYLINKESIEAIVAFNGMDSATYYVQGKGVRKVGVDAHRVMTRAMCKKFGALEPAVWSGQSKSTKIYALDAAYGNLGGDRCVGGFIEFGKDVQGRIIFEMKPHVIVPVSVKNEESPEDQIAEFVKKDCEANGIPPENVFFDATGRGSLGTSFARLWSAQVNPVEFGGAATNRPVCQDLFVMDEETKQRRLKLCNEQYSKFVTELWFSVRYTVESGQMRGLSQEVMEEFCAREWRDVRGDKKEIETKTEMKLRYGRSPDLADWLATACEGARRRGFQIARMASVTSSKDKNDFMERMKERANTLLRAHELNYK